MDFCRRYRFGDYPFGLRFSQLCDQQFGRRDHGYLLPVNRFWQGGTLVQLTSLMKQAPRPLARTVGFFLGLTKFVGRGMKPTTRKIKSFTLMVVMTIVLGLSFLPSQALAESQEEKDKASNYGINPIAKKAGLTGSSLSKSTVPVLIGNIVAVALSFTGSRFYFNSLRRNFMDDRRRQRGTSGQSQNDFNGGEHWACDCALGLRHYQVCF